MKTRWVCLAVLLCSVVALLASQAQDTGQLQVRVGFERPDGSRQIQNSPLETSVARVLAGEAAPQTPPGAERPGFPAVTTRLRFQLLPSPMFLRCTLMPPPSIPTRALFSTPRFARDRRSITDGR